MEMDWIISQPLFSQEMYMHKIGESDLTLMVTLIYIYYIVQSKFTL